MRTTTIQIARILRDALDPGDLARVAEALEGYLIDNEGAADPTVARRTDVAGDLIERIEALVGDEVAPPAGDDPAPGDASPPTPEDTLAEALRRVDECLDRAEGAAERMRGEDGRSVREAIDDASEIVARALRGPDHLQAAQAPPELGGPPGRPRESLQGDRRCWPRCRCCGDARTGGAR